MNIKLFFYLFIVWYLLPANTTFAYTHADTLRGSNGRGRDWWDVQKYSLRVAFDMPNKKIRGQNIIALKTVNIPTDSMQIDLQYPMILDSAVFEGQKLEIAREGNVWWVKHPFHNLGKGVNKQVVLNYHGSPREAVNPPWDGGFSWTNDTNGKAWTAVSCQGLGASVWWPCKDAQWDEPDSGMNISLSIPDTEAEIVSNGRLLQNGGPNRTGKVDNRLGRKRNWVVADPINTYDVTFYIGDYTHWHDTLMGEKGVLDLDYWVLSYNEEKAKKQFAVVKQMLHCFEYWLGPYPFYKDGYKLVESPYLGMEHQGAIAYGNNYQMGYEGWDRTMTGIGMSFDYIIIHESGHEWFGNSITAKDIADNWIHEGITTYSESLFAEYTMGKEKGQKYCRGEWHNIQNRKPVIGDYGVNEEGSKDMYDKGAAIMYMIRALTGDDEKFRMMLRGLSKDFYHQTVTTQQVENYIAGHTGLDLRAFFDQYLRTAAIPQVEYYVKEETLNYRFSNTTAGFTLPIEVKASDTTLILHPTADWQHMKWKKGFDLNFSKEFLFKVKE